MATKLGFRRFLATILAALAVAVTSSARAQNWMPLLPDQDFYDFQLFAPPDLHEYSVRHSPREGIFFTYDRTYWAFTVPPSRAILNDFFIPTSPLSPFAVAELNNNLIRSGFPGANVYVYGADPMRLDLNTNWMRTNMSWGNRFEGGWIYDDFGMLFNYYDSGPQSQSFMTLNEFAANSPTTTFAQNFTTPLLGQPLIVTTLRSTSPPPDHVIRQELNQTNVTELRSAGFSWIVRRNLSEAGSGRMSSVRFAVGPKFLQVSDRYSIDYDSFQSPFLASPNPLPYNGPLQNGGWDVSSYNNIVGPEIGLNWQAEQGRWTFETDLRFVAGMNFQNTLYRGSNFPAALGADYFRSTLQFANVVAQNALQFNASSVNAPPQFVQVYGIGQTNNTNTAEHNFVFSPLGEWRLRGRYRISQGISLSLGYTGMWLAGITRASSNMEFQERLRPVINATQNGPPIPVTLPNPQYNPNQPTGPDNPQFITQNVTSWTPPPVNTPVPPGSPVISNNRLRVYNQIGPSPGNDLSYLFVNGVDFGLEINY